MKIRSPKSKVRKKAGEPNSKNLTQKVSFGFWHLDFSWASCFGFQILPFLPLAAHAQATNDIPPLLPAYPELPPTFWEQHGGWVVALGGMLMALVAFGVWWLLRPTPPVVVPIEVQTRQKLEALRQQSEDGRTLSQVSRILRRYVAGAFALPPEEMTTAEFCRAIEGRETIGPDFAASVSEFLRQCDERKFTPPNPRPEMGAADRALKLVELGEARRAQLRQTANAEAAVHPAPRA